MREFPDHEAEMENPGVAWPTPGVGRDRAQSLGDRGGICGTVYQKGENSTERMGTLEICGGSLSSIQQSANCCMQMRKLSKTWKEPSKGIKERCWCSHRAGKMPLPSSQTHERKTLHSQGLGKNIQEGLASVVGNR